MPRLAVQSIIGKTHLGPNHVYMLIREKHAAVISNVPVANSHAYINEHILDHGLVEYLGDDFPRVEERVTLNCVGQLAISRSPHNTT